MVSQMEGFRRGFQMVSQMEGFRRKNMAEGPGAEIYGTPGLLGFAWDLLDRSAHVKFDVSAAGVCASRGISSTELLPSGRAVGWFHALADPLHRGPIPSSAPGPSAIFSAGNLHLRHNIQAPYHKCRHQPDLCHIFR